MKKIVFGVLLFTSLNLSAQWSNGGGPTNNWGNGAGPSTLQAWRSYGFGRFTFYNALPEARIHLSEHYLESPWTGTNGELFRTDGGISNSNHWRLYTGNSGTTNLQRFRVSALQFNGGVEIGATQTTTEDLHLLTNDLRRVTIRGEVASNPFRGFVGFNNQNPIFHLDMITHERNQGELLLRSRVEGDLTAWLGFLNLAGQGSTWFSPALMGRQATNGLPALSTVGSIENNQDVAANVNAVTRFISGRDYDPVISDFTLDRINVVENRRIFQWFNAVDALMTMEANGFTGIGTDDPGNRLELNSDFYDPATGLPTGFPGAAPITTDQTDNGIPGLNATNATGFSGLRFSDLSSNSNPQLTNPGAGVLALDANGDVIYVGAGGGGGYALCTDPASITDLTDDGKMGLSDFNFYFEGQGVSNNHVGIGYFCSSGLPGKLSVLETAGNSIGVFSQVQAGGAAFGGLFRVSGGSFNTGVRANADGGSNAVGGDFQSAGASFNIGVRGIASGGTSYGVYGQAVPQGAPNYAGYFDGDVFISGMIVPSDQSLKTNVQDINGAMNIISQLQPKTFEYDQTSFPSMNLQGGNQFGLIAQDVQSVLPELISNNVHPPQYDTLGNLVNPSINFLGLEYTELIPILVAGIKEQQTQMDAISSTNDSLQSLVNDLDARLILLENCLSNILPALCQANAMMIESTPEAVQEELRSIIDVNLSDRNNIVLNQNAPNPFAERTVITYMIPETIVKAQINFYDGTGKLIHSVEITERGNGQLNVFASDLSSGIYTYSLVADGNVVATKRMVKE